MRTTPNARRNRTSLKRTQKRSRPKLQIPHKRTQLLNPTPKAQPIHHKIQQSTDHARQSRRNRPQNSGIRKRAQTNLRTRPNGHRRSGKLHRIGTNRRTKDAAGDRRNSAGNRSHHKKPLQRTRRTANVPNKYLKKSIHFHFFSEISKLIVSKNVSKKYRNHMKINHSCPTEKLMLIPDDSFKTGDISRR